MRRNELSACSLWAFCLCALVSLLASTCVAGTGLPASHLVPHYSISPTFPAPPDYGYRPTRWRPWNRSTIYPVYPGMQPPPSSPPQKQQAPGTLPPLPLEDEQDEGADDLPGASPLERNGDEAPALPRDLDPGLPLPGQEPATDELPPILPDDKTEPAAPDDLFQPPSEDTEDTEDSEPVDDLFRTPAEPRRPTDEPPLQSTGRNRGSWKTARHLATAWRNPSDRPIQRTQAARMPAASSTTTDRDTPWHGTAALQPLQPAWPQNPLRRGRIVPTSADGSRVVPAAVWD